MGGGERGGESLCQSTGYRPEGHGHVYFPTRNDSFVSCNQTSSFIAEYVRSFVRGSPNLKRQFLTTRYVFIVGEIFVNRLCGGTIKSKICAYREIG